MTTRLLAALGASCCFAVTLAALGWGTADLAAVRGRLAMQDWSRLGYVDSSEEWRLGYERLQTARRINWLSADHSANLARLLEWQAWRQAPGSPAQHEYRLAAGRLHAEALAKRPGWGLAWAQLAENRLLRGSRDEEFVQALERAMRLAPWEPVVQVKVAWMGMAAWEDLPGEIRRDVLRSAARALELEEHTEEIVRLAFQYDWLEHLVPMLRTSRQREIFEFVHRQATRHRVTGAIR